MDMRWVSVKPPTTFCGAAGMSAGRHSHFVLRKFSWIQAFEPLVDLVVIQPLRAEVDSLRIVDDRLLHEDWRPRPQRQRDRVARTGIDGNPLALDGEMDEGEERVVLQVADDDSIDASVEVSDDVAQQV